MRNPGASIETRLTKPLLSHNAHELAEQLKTVSETEIKQSMRVSSALATRTVRLIQEWNQKPTQQMAAADSFLGDVYSGLRYRTLSSTAIKYADTHLRIISGLYGLLKPRDGIYPYRLEMGYKLPALPENTLYDYWRSAIADCIPRHTTIVNLAPAEYSKAVLPYLHKETLVISPQFLTYSKKTKKPKQVAVHAKIARGAFARWLLKNSTKDTHELHTFDLLGYRYQKSLSTDQKPVFVCRKFQGLGLSIK